MIKYITLLSSLIFVVLISSCVPQKKLSLLQQDSQVDNHVDADVLIKTFELNKSVYKLRPGDVISLQVQSTTQQEFNFLASSSSEATGVNPKDKGYKLDAEGNILLPVVGEVALEGLTLAETRQKLSKELKPYLSKPNVFVSLLNFKFTVLGEVGSQGQIVTDQDEVNVIEAIALAGGFNPYSDRSKIRLMRYDGDQAQLYTFSMLDDDIIKSKNFYLQPNDMIMVDPLPAKYFRENILPAFTLGMSILTTLTVLTIRFVQ